MLSQATAAKVAAAKKVLVIGGGPVGVEVAAEMLVAHPGKDVTVVTGATRLLDTKAPALGANCKAFLERNGGKVGD
jgi:NADPH-dependent 2,4-dienoyl-CoA reductase/sulfur reductase-like enzyme